MMNSQKNAYKVVSLFCVMMVLLAACTSKRKLQPLQTSSIYQLAYADLEARFCTQAPNQFRQKLKFIFIMDKSSSNQQVSQQLGGGTMPPTDPTGQKRYRQLLNYLQAATPDPGYTYYSLINFSDSNKTARVQTGGVDFTDVPSAFYSTINNQLNNTVTNDIGYTDYLSALGEAINLIAADVTAEQINSNGQVIASLYMVIFISDGAPVVTSGVQQSSAILSKINGPAGNGTIPLSLMGFKSHVNYQAWVDDVVVHTGYYFAGQPDAAAVTLLQQMSAAGNGDFYSFGAGVDIDYSLFAVPVRNVRYHVTDLFIENASTVWWDDGRLLLDSDHDGLPDEIELSLNSDPNSPDTDGNGVSDGVEYRTKGRPCNDAKCSRLASVRDNYPSCTGLMAASWPDGSSNPKPDGVNASPNGSVYFGDRDKDGLNDCEEWILRSDRDKFDSNGDHIPDHLSFKFQIPFIAGTNALGGNMDNDELNNYLEVKKNLPPLYQNTQLKNVKSLNYALVREASQGQQDCYYLKAENVGILGPDNLIKTYVIQSTAVLDQKPVLKVSEKALVGGAKKISLTDGDFK